MCIWDSYVYQKGLLCFLIKVMSGRLKGIVFSVSVLRFQYSLKLLVLYISIIHYSHVTPVNIMASMGWKREGRQVAAADIFSSPCDFHLGCGKQRALESAAGCSRQPATAVRNVWIHTSTFSYLYLLRYYYIIIHSKCSIIYDLRYFVTLYCDQQMHNYHTCYPLTR